MTRLKLVLIFGFFCIFNSSYGQISSHDSLHSLISTQVSLIYGPRYNIYIDVIDALIGRKNERGLVYEDPYGTLSGCTVFEADGIYNPQDNFSPNGFVGIFKNGKILWHSDTIINSYFGSYPSVLSTKDLNRDGKVDIITSWLHGGGALDAAYLWILSWDGQSASFLNNFDVDPTDLVRGISDIDLLTETIELVDIDGDGITEVQGRLPRDSVVIYKWDGRCYTKWNGSSQFQSPRYLPKNSLSAIVHSRVDQIGNTYKYQYTLTNLQTSIQELEDFHIVCDTPFNYRTSSSRSQWDFFHTFYRNFICWEDFHERNLIHQGESDSSFSFITSKLPAIRSFYIQGANHSSSQPRFEEMSWYDDITNNSKNGLTISPGNPIFPFNDFNFLDTLKSYTTQSISLGWIKNQSAANTYSALFDSAKTQLQRNDNRSVCSTLDMVMQHAVQDSSGVLSSEAFALIYFNTQYLLKQLPAIEKK